MSILEQKYPTRIVGWRMTLPLQLLHGWKLQNKVTNDYLSKIPFRDALLKRLTDVANYEKIGTPFKKHGKYYFYKNDGLQNQSVLYVQDSLDGEPRVFLDPNKLSDDGTVALTGIYFSNNGNIPAIPLRVVVQTGRKSM